VAITKRRLDFDSEGIDIMFKSKLRYFTWQRYPPWIIDGYDACASWINQCAEEECSFFFTSVNSLVYGPESATVDDVVMFV
jgi:hypothetical protein